MNGYELAEQAEQAQLQNEGAVEYCHCHSCGSKIDGENAVEKDGVWYHEKCYDRV